MLARLDDPHDQNVRIKGLESSMAFFLPAGNTLIVTVNDICECIQRCASVVYLHSACFTPAYSPAAEARVSSVLCVARAQAGE